MDRKRQKATPIPARGPRKTVCFEDDREVSRVQRYMDSANIRNISSALRKLILDRLDDVESGKVASAR